MIQGDNWANLFQGESAIDWPFFKDYRERLDLEFLPAYSPELNPIERVWKLTRRLCTHDTYFEKIDS